MCNIFTCYLYNSVYKRLGVVYLKRMYIIISYTKLSEKTGKTVKTRVKRFQSPKM